MSAISQYFLSICGVVLLSVLMDLIVSDGKIAKYQKSIMSLILIFVIVSPLPKLLKNDVDFSSFFDNNISYNEEYTEVFMSQQKTILEKGLEQNLKQNGFDGVKIEIWADFEDNALKINNVFVDLQNLVLSQENEHINYYEAIKILLMEQTGVEEGRVIICE